MRAFDFDAMEPTGPQSVGRRTKGSCYWEALSGSCAGK